MNFSVRDDSLKILLLAAFFAYLPFTFLNYGSDGDSWGVVYQTAKGFYEQGVYRPSRYPGYPVHEIATTVLNRLGGAFLSNLGTVFISLLAVFCFYRICEFYKIPNKLLICACVAFHPIYVVNAACTIDYLWAVGLFLAGFYLYRVKNRFLFAGVFFGLSVGCRLSSLFLVFAFFLTELTFHFRPFFQEKRRLAAAALAGILGALTYLPVYIFAGRNFSFLTYFIGDWTYYEFAVRFVYKNIYFWGLPAFVLLLYFIAVNVLRAEKRRALLRQLKANREIYFFSAIACALLELLFLKVPLEEGYLLPLLPFALLFVNLLFERERNLWRIFLIALVSYNAVNFDVVKVDREDYAQSGEIGFYIEKGYLWRDVEKRKRAAEINTKLYEK